MLLKQLGIRETTFESISDSKVFQYGLDIKINQKVVGQIGKIDGTILEYFDILSNFYSIKTYTQKYPDKCSKMFYF